MDTTEETKTLYEIGILINGDLDESDANKAQKTVEELIEKHATAITEQGAQALQPLAYRINKKKTAYFSWIRFEAESSAIKAITDILRYNPQVLRSLIIKLDRGDLTQETRHERRYTEHMKQKQEKETKNKKEEETSLPIVTEEPTPSEQHSSSSKDQLSSSEVDVQELDKKLAEIL
ncbi:MAG: 30S ribosomal protein S6 [Patescibacteria group bacterium]|nr:30S ribosomal protein S6 [Patescibacteria group bacterium]MDE2438014.1 30S ribosomal protein S6 [Patescibacteria group bacterium]